MDAYGYRKTVFAGSFAIDRQIMSNLCPISGVGFMRAGANSDPTVLKQTTRGGALAIEGGGRGSRAGARSRARPGGKFRRRRGHRDYPLQIDPQNDPAQFYFFPKNLRLSEIPSSRAQRCAPHQRGRSLGETGQPSTRKV